MSGCHSANEEPPEPQLGLSRNLSELMKEDDEGIFFEKGLRCSNLTSTAHMSSQMLTLLVPKPLALKLHESSSSQWLKSLHHRLLRAARMLHQTAVALTQGAEEPRWQTREILQEEAEPSSS